MPGVETATQVRVVNDFDASRKLLFSASPAPGTHQVRSRPSNSASLSAPTFSCPNT